ncbi:MAG: FAD-dependent monooxygenase [Burkholderiales bacterium]
MQPLPEHAALVIAGGGPVGAALAVGLRGSGIEPVLLEANPAPGADDDARFLALSFGSRLILERLGVWAQIEPCSTPIRSIEVSQRGGFGRTELDASDVRLPALGHVVRYRDLARVLSDAAGNCARVARGMRVSDVKSLGDFAVIECADSSSHAISTPLVALADGGRSLTAQGAPRVRDYHQWAVVAWARWRGVTAIAPTSASRRPDPRPCCRPLKATRSCSRCRKRRPSRCAWRRTMRSSRTCR